MKKPLSRRLKNIGMASEKLYQNTLKVMNTLFYVIFGGRMMGGFKVIEFPPPLTAPQRRGKRKKPVLMGLILILELSNNRLLLLGRDIITVY